MHLLGERLSTACWRPRGAWMQCGQDVCSITDLLFLGLEHPTKVLTVKAWSVA